MRLLIRLAVLVGVFALLASGAGAVAEDGTGTVVGTVVDREGHPVRLIDVEADAYDVAAVKTDDEGGFELVDVPSGTELTVTFSDWDFSTFSTRSTKVTVGAGEQADLGTITIDRDGRPGRAAGAVDLGSRSAVATAFTKVLKPTLRHESGARPKGCRAGTTRAATQKRTIRAVNYYRSMAGLDPVRLSKRYSALAQRSSLLMYRNNTLSHFPPRSWKCWSKGGYEGASHSNLYLGETAARAVQGYMVDPGGSNTAAGHRRWILSPSTRAMGTGDVGFANSLYVVGSIASGRATPEWIPWPSAGYFPSQEEPWGRWSLSSTRPDTSFDDARVSVRTASGRALAVTRYRPEDGYGRQNALVWGVRNVPQVRGRSVVALTVTVRHIAQRGVFLEPYSYRVRLFKP